MPFQLILSWILLELNGHMMANLVFNVALGIFPPEPMRTWLAGSQACEQLFRLLRSTTSTFSTMINFSLKGIMEKIHKLQHISASESDDNIIFPRVKRRLLHLKEESNETFAVPNVDLITDEISKAKVDATEVCKSCDMVLNSYEDKDLVQNVEKVVEEAIQHDHEYNEGSIIENDDSSGPSEVAMTQEDIVTINEDLSIIKLRKKALSVGLRTYQVSDKDEVCSSGKNYSLSGKTKDKKKSKESSTEAQTKSVSPFVL